MKTTMVFLLILLSFANQCAQEAIGPELVRAHLGEEFNLEVNSTAVLLAPAEGQATKLKVRFDKLQDSRCPADVVCITAGSAEVTLTLSHPTGGSQALSLCLGDCASGTERSFRLTDEAEVRLGNETYEVLLKEVSPYPMGNQELPEQKKKQATLVISRK